MIKFDINSDHMPGTKANPMPGDTTDEIDAARAEWAAADPLTQKQRNAKTRVTMILRGTEPHGGLSALEIADVISNVAEHGAAARIARHENDGGSDLTTEEKADLDKLLGRPSRGKERLLLGQCIQALIE